MHPHPTTHPFNYIECLECKGNVAAMLNSLSLARIVIVCEGERKALPMMELKSLDSF